MHHLTLLSDTIPRPVHMIILSLVSQIKIAFDWRAEVSRGTCIQGISSKVISVVVPVVDLAVVATAAIVVVVGMEDGMYSFSDGEANMIHVS